MLRVALVVPDGFGASRLAVISGIIFSVVCSGIHGPGFTFVLPGP